MKVLDPGHRYQLDQFDGEGANILQFMKREGPGYPGNVGTSPGTNIQEALRALIDRVEYLDNQIHDIRNLHTINSLRDCIWFLEHRAAERHGLPINMTLEIEKEPTCAHCGHVVCHEMR